MGRDYIHELYLTPSDSEGLNLMNIMLVVYGYSRICGGSRGSDHCACLTRSDVTGNHVTFPPYFILSSSAKKCWLGVFSKTSASYNHRKPPPFIFIFYSVYVV
jgi:hypothetical protein